MAEHLLARRLEDGLTQKALAKRLEVDEFTVVNWELGHTMPLPHRYARIVRYLGFDPTPAGETLPERLKAYRRRVGLTQVEAAKRFEIDGKTWWEWENEKRAPTQINAVRIDRFFHGGNDQEPPGGATFGRRLRWWRIREGLSQRRLAQRLGVHATTIRAWELGYRTPSASTVREASILLHWSRGTTT